MAKIPRQVSRQVIPSGRVAGAIIPTGIADVGQGIEARGLGALGVGVGDLGQALQQIALADGKSEASTARGLADSEIRLLQESLKANNDPKTFDDELTKSLETIQGFRPESGVGGKQFDDFLEDAVPAWQSGVNILKIQRTQSNIEAAYIANSARASAAGDIVELSRLIDEAVNTTGVITPEQGARDLASGEAVVNRINKQRDETTVLDAAFAVWRDTGQLKDGLAVIDQSGLDDKARVENEFKTRVTNRRAEEKIRLEEQQETDRGTINDAMYVNKNYSVSFDAIQNSSLSETEKRPLFKENEDRARLAASGRSEANDPVALDKVTTAIAQLGNDTLPLADAKKIFSENSHLLKATTADELWKQLIGEFDRSIDTASARVRSDIRLRAIGRTESALDRLLEALAGASGKDQLKLEERIATAREKFNLELSNFNRWEETQRAWRRANNEATPEQIQKEGMRAWFTEFAGKDTTRLRLEESIGEVPGKKPSSTSLLPNGRVLMRNPPRKMPASRGGGTVPGTLFQINPEDVNKKLADGWKLVPIKDRPKKEKPPEERIRMVSPDGRTGTISADKVDEAIAQGWKRL